MNRQEQVGRRPVGHRRSLLERHEFVAAPRQDHFNTRRLQQNLLEAESNVEDQRGLVQSFDLGPGVVPAMPRVDEIRAAPSPSCRESEYVLVTGGVVTDARAVAFGDAGGAELGRVEAGGTLGHGLRG